MSKVKLVLLISIMVGCGFDLLMMLVRIMSGMKDPGLSRGLIWFSLPGIPFFDPFAHDIVRVDQWVCIPRLPLDILITLLNDVGTIVKVDHFTMLRLHGKYSRVCLNIDITKPLRGCINLIKYGVDREVPLYYEGLHEICTFCGDVPHKLGHCPIMPVPRSR